jgi:hypothetical protein
LAVSCVISLIRWLIRGVFCTAKFEILDEISINLFGRGVA